MICEVSASYLYQQDGQTYERTIDILFQTEEIPDAILAGIRWAKERGESLEWGFPVCIKLHPFFIERPGVTGYIATRRGFPFFEWKYDTSPFRFEQLLTHHLQLQGG